MIIAEKKVQTREKDIGMEKNIFEINKQNLSFIYEICKSFRQQNFFVGTSKLNSLIKNMNDVVEFVFSQEDGSASSVELQQVLSALLQAQNNQDYILLADILEGDLLLVLQQIQIELQNTGNVVLEEYWKTNMNVLKNKGQILYHVLMENEKEWFSSKRYQMTLAINGQPTVQAKRDSKVFFMHSSVNSETEAKALVDTLPEAEQYVVIGLGLGYHVLELLEKYPNCKVTVLESEKRNDNSSISLSQLGGKLKDRSFKYCI